ncbi:chromatin modification-related protein [Favolaschia claudopus]|uniref:Chromatin modification-related protein n=1 Tax=Favolaschia claudopus TaxID=2862362 RepID=A0AAW0EII4_9AGAR
MNTTPQSLEDASTIVSEFIYSLDNLPNEVAHLLQEIKEKEIRVQDLQAEIDRDSSRYIRHSLKAANSASSSSSVSPSPAASRAPSPKSMAIPGKISAAYAEINELSNEKIALAQRIIDLITRTRARLDSDLTKVRVLQGELPEQPTFSSASTTGMRLPRIPSAIGSPMIEADVYIGASRNPVSQLGESLRNALGASASMPEIRQQAPATPTAVASASSVGPSNKKRRITAAPTSIKLAPVATPTPPRRSASPLTTSVAPNAHSNSNKRSRLSRQIHPTREEMDVSPEAEEEGEGEGEDERPYCFCQKQSYGDMIACDNDGCKYEWFHLACVQLSQPTPDKWYCRDCIEKGFAAGQAQRKGRKR